MTPRDLRTAWDRLNRLSMWLSDLTVDLEHGHSQGSVMQRLRLLDARIGRLAEDIQPTETRKHLSGKWGWTEGKPPCERDRSSTSHLRPVS